LILGAIAKHGTLQVPLPPAPPAFLYGTENEAQKALTAGGFVHTTIQTAVLRWHPKDTEEILELLYKSIVRLTLVLKAQSEEARERIHGEILREGRKFETDNGLEVKFPVLIACGQKSRNRRAKP
jgi:hypothetical protein